MVCDEIRYTKVKLMEEMGLDLIEVSGNRELWDPCCPLTHPLTHFSALTDASPHWGLWTPRALKSVLFFITPRASHITHLLALLIFNPQFLTQFLALMISRMKLAFNTFYEFNPSPRFIFTLQQTVLSFSTESDGIALSSGVPFVISIQRSTWGRPGMMQGSPMGE